MEQVEKQVAQADHTVSDRQKNSTAAKRAGLSESNVLQFRIMTSNLPLPPVSEYTPITIARKRMQLDGKREMIEPREYNEGGGGRNTTVPTIIIQMAL